MQQITVVSSGYQAGKVIKNERPVSLVIGDVEMTLPRHCSLAKVLGWISRLDSAVKTKQFTNHNRRIYSGSVVVTRCFTVG